MEDWEEQHLYKEDCVSEALLLAKYRGLAFFDLDDQVTRIVEGKNLEWVKKVRGQKGSKSHWTMIGYSPKTSDEENHYVGFENHLLIELIAETKQAAGVEIVQRKDSEESAPGVDGEMKGGEC